jgi:peptidoglycan/xylan/chitin deacetylase (PgdA/CDA1 family)
LLNKDNFKQVRKWAESGHEIGNHTLTHPQNLAELSPKQIFKEIKQAHDIIGDCIGYAPKGFISPAWSYSPIQAEILTQLNYSYDTSLFPSFLMPLVQLKLRLQSQVNQKMIPVIRKDFYGSFFGSRQPYFVSKESPWANHAKIGDLIMLPLPMTKCRIPLWHSMSFILSKRQYEKALNSALDVSDCFYYLMHPADLVDPTKDCNHLNPAIKTIERFNISITQKMENLTNSLKIVSEKCDFVTMSELAKRQRKILNGKAY